MSGMGAVPILAGSIKTEHLADNAVTSPKIGVNEVKGTHIAGSAVGNVHLANNA
ncbi:hypothetical protein SAMN05216224_108147, partial [Thioclava dalianensis]